MSPSRSNNTWLADQPLQRKIVLAIGLLLGLFLVTSAITLHSLRQQQSDRYWSMHTYQVLLQLDQVQRAAQTSQLAARDYLRTRRRDAVENAVDDLRTHLATLRQLTSDNPLQRSRIDKLETMATQWHDEFRHGLIEASTGMQASEPAQAALERLHLQTDYLEHRTVTVEDMSAVLDQMVEYENKLLAERNQQLDGTLSTTRVINAAAALLGILLGIAVIRLTLALVTRPLRKLTTQLTRLANHDHDFEIHRLDRRDEIGEIARALHVFRQMSRDTQAQSWIKEQVSGISQLLLQATTRREFAQWLTSELVPLCDSAVGLFYSYDDAHRRLELLGSHGLPLIHRPDAQHLSGEDLLEQCVAGRKAIILDDAPVDCLPVAPSADDAPPRHLAIIPVLYRDTLIGVLELAGHGALSPLNLQLLEELLPIVALNLENLTHTINTHDLLLRTREQADDLRVSELVMRQQKEVLRDNNDALQAKTLELEEQRRRLIASEDELRVQAVELQASNAELRETTAKLARASQYKSEFLANMSHELRTPLNSMLILSRSLAGNSHGNLDADQVESAQIIHEAGNSLLYLINDILDLSKIEAGKMALVIDELSLAGLVQRLRRTFGPVAEQKGLHFTLDIAPGLPAIVRTDGARLEQIANNLLSNAFKFTASGSVSVCIGRPDDTIDVPAALRSEPLIALTVSDTGIGIPAGKLERIFNAFEQVDAGTSRQFGGTGLGLAISRRLATMLGGDLLLRSEPDHGSRFTVLLPETPPPAAPDSLPYTEAIPATPSPSSSAPRAPVDPAATSRLAGHRVLLVDDDMRNLFALSRVLRDWGMQVSMAQNGPKALTLLADELAPDVLLMDIMMPGMDGYETIGAVRADPRFARLPIIALTAKAMHGDREKCLAMGASDYLSKPIDIDQLAARMNAWLQR